MQYLYLTKENHSLKTCMGPNTKYVLHCPQRRRISDRQPVRIILCMGYEDDTLGHQGQTITHILVTVTCGPPRQPQPHVWSEIYTIFLFLVYNPG